MFTGIVQEVGRLLRRDSRADSTGSDLRVAISCGPELRERLTLGASVAVDGVCLTVAALETDSFEADVSGETLAVTRFARCEKRVRQVQCVSLAIYSFDW